MKVFLVAKITFQIKDLSSVTSMLSFPLFYPWTNTCTRDSWSNKSPWVRQAVPLAPQCWLAAMARHGPTQIWRENRRNSRCISRAAEAEFCIIWGRWLFILAEFIQVLIIWDIFYYRFHWNSAQAEMSPAGFNPTELYPVWAEFLWNP